MSRPFCLGLSLLRTLGEGFHLILKIWKYSSTDLSYHNFPVFLSVFGCTYILFMYARVFFIALSNFFHFSLRPVSLNIAAPLRIDVRRPSDSQGLSVDLLLDLFHSQHRERGDGNYVTNSRVNALKVRGLSIGFLRGPQLGPPMEGKSQRSPSPAVKGLKTHHCIT